MFTRKTILALTTVAAFAALALDSTSASARGFGGRGGFHFGSGGGFHSGAIHLATGGIHPGPIGPGHFPVRGFPGHEFPGRGFGWNHWHHHCWNWHDCGGWGPGWGVVDGTTVTSTVDTTTTTSQAAANCNCLTKQYLDDGSVLFTDTCTKEQAMATPDELKAQAKQ